MTAMTTSTPMIAALLDAAVYDHPVGEIRLVETHISWVILTGDYVYKIKKPVDLGFLDFSTLERRRFYCHEEVRLNRRLAPDIYLDVVPVTGTEDRPALGGEGTVIDYAVRMRQFSPAAQLDILLAHGALEPWQLDAVARLVAKFHDEIAVAGPETDYGEPASICYAVKENIRHIRDRLQQDATTTELDALGEWIEAACTRLAAVFRQRKTEGFIRECHGDMHLRNLAWFDDKPLVFDCIEFNPQLRWIDVQSEIAFLVMDLQDRGQPQLGWRVLNTYLEHSGDYAGVGVLPFYLLYRALVRAKVEAIRATQAGIGADERAAVLREFQGYLRLAGDYTRAGRPVLIVTRGPSASGKSTISRPLLEALGALRVRSDVERKRLFGIAPTTDMHAGIDAGIYSAEASRQTYDRLASLAEQVVTAGYSIIVDAVFQQTAEVERFRTLAAQLGVGFVILEFTAPADVLRQRIEARPQGVSDADRAVLERQLSTWQALSGETGRHCIEVDTTAAPAVEELVGQIGALAEPTLPQPA